MMYSKTSAVAHDNRPQTTLNFVPKGFANRVFKDKQILSKISAFPVPGSSRSEEMTLVVSSHPSSNTHSTPLHSIPVWSRTNDLVKATAATGALLISDQPAWTFTFNLTDRAIEKALADRAGFVDSLKRSFDKVLARAGVRLDYWFAIDIDEKGRLHIHGAFNCAREDHPALKDLMRKAWGDWPGRGKQFQIKIDPLRDDGWTSYVFEDQRRVIKKIGTRTWTITRPLQRDAEWVYTEIRRIMREGVAPEESVKLADSPALNLATQQRPDQNNAPAGSAANPETLPATDQPADDLRGIELPEESSAYSEEFLDDLLAGLDDPSAASP